VERFSVVCQFPDDRYFKFTNTHVVSQFTLLASTKKGNKPDFHRSATGEKAKELYSHFFAKVQELYDKDKVKDGVFQAMMDVALVNDGPVGVNYTSEDGVVYLLYSQYSFSLLTQYQGHFGA
jgi:hypothetical protein